MKFLLTLSKRPKKYQSQQLLPLDLQAAHPLGLQAAHPLDLQAAHPLDLQAAHPLDLQAAHPPALRHPLLTRKKSQSQSKNQLRKHQSKTLLKK
jgi:hypothetical protein